MELLRLATAGLGRRRQEHPHRPTPLRLQGHLRGPARIGRAGEPPAGDEYTDLALLTDGLRAEREQGITIDVAYRYFATPARKFIIADTPGHIQYTRNMVTGNSTADLTIVLVDARKGIVEQTRRHAFLASLLRVPHLLLCVNKMDLVGFDRDVSNRSARSSPPSPAGWRCPISASSPSPPCRATTWCSDRPTCPGMKVRHCFTISSRSTSPPTAT